MDVAFGEDQSRKRVVNAAENFGILGRLVPNLLKTGKTINAGIKCIRKMAGWDKSYIEWIRLLLKI